MGMASSQYLKTQRLYQNIWYTNVTYKLSDLQTQLKQSPLKGPSNYYYQCILSSELDIQLLTAE